MSAPSSSFTSKLKPSTTSAIVVGGVVLSVGIIAARRYLSPARGFDVAPNDEQVAASEAASRSSTTLTVKALVGKEGRSSIPEAAGFLAHYNAENTMWGTIASAATLSVAQKASFVTSLYTVFLKSSVPASYGAVVMAARNGSSLAAVAVWFPPGANLTKDVLQFNGLTATLLANVGPVGATRTSIVFAAMMQRRERVTAALGGKVYQLLTFGAVSDEAFAAVAAPLFARSRATETPILIASATPKAKELLLRHGFVEYEKFAFHSAYITLLVRPYDA